MQYERAAGVLLHITSLPRGESAIDFGVGDLGRAAHQFLDFLERAGQRVWQVLPLGPSLHAESPYSCYSAFAGNPLLISMDDLVQRDLLDEIQLREIHQKAVEALGEESETAPGQCNYALARRTKPVALRLAYQQFLAKQSCSLIDEFESFCVNQRWWLDDFALYAALREEKQSDDWSQWEPELVARDPNALGQWREKLDKQVEFEQFVQYLFFEQWQALKEAAARRNIDLFGDMPIFVAHGSADVWAHQGSFLLNKHGRPKVVAGVPPDYFSKTGQLWGNPLYDWEAMESRNYSWWVQRLRAAFELFDLVRIDHFRGFESYWAVPAKAKTAVSGSWEPGPGAAPFQAARKVLGDLAIIAEDLGLITDEVHALRDALEFPGMRVLQFGFDSEDSEFHRPDAYPANCVAYTGTHDNSTIAAWYRAGTKNKTRCQLLEPWLELQPQNLRVHWQLLSMVYASKARLAMAPMQDILGLGEEGLMNQPGKAEGNWLWRLEPKVLTEELAGKLRQICRDCKRR